MILDAVQGMKGFSTRNRGLKQLGCSARTPGLVQAAFLWVQHEAADPEWVA